MAWSGVAWRGVMTWCNGISLRGVAWRAVALG